MFLHFISFAFFLVNCVVSQWSSCSKTCGPGTQQRSVLTPANYGGLQCPNLTKNCSLKSCPAGHECACENLELSLKNDASRNQGHRAGNYKIQAEQINNRNVWKRDDGQYVVWYNDDMAQWTIGISIGSWGGIFSPRWFNSCPNEVGSQWTYYDGSSRTRLAGNDVSVKCPDDPCHMEHKNFTSYKRIRTYATPIGQGQADNSECTSTADDWKGPGWYRFTGGSGTMLATSKVKDYHCGTAFPGYLKDGKGSLPTRSGQEVDATVCFYMNSSEPCQNPRKIKIKMCGDYFIYNLPTALACYNGYCGQQ